MRIRSSLLAALGLSALLLATAHAAIRQEDRPRSVVFYLMDTCRNDRMSFSGYGRPTTPFLEWIAERAVVFENCYSQAPWTKPSMAALLTSRIPSSRPIHMMEFRLPDGMLTWPEVLQSHGMYTAGFSANIVMGKLLSNYAQGFDHFVESTAINHGDPIRFASGSARKVNDHAVAFLDETDHWPMLLYLHSVDPHEEYQPEPRYLRQFADPERDPVYREEWLDLLASRPPIPGLHVTQDNFDRTGIDSASFIEHGSNLYDADIRANDDQIELLWTALQEDGWGDDVIFVFTSDHGEEFYEHGATSHGYSVYEEMTHVPLMIYAPGLLPEGKRISTPVRSIDIFPTLCELLGYDVPPGLDGESLLPLIHEDGPHDLREVYSVRLEDPRMQGFGLALGDMISLRLGRWSCILNLGEPAQRKRPRVELFDRETDPREQHDVAGEHPEVVKFYQEKLEVFLAERLQEGPAAGARPLDPAVREQLAELGYVEGEESDAGSTPDIWRALESKDPDRIGSALAAGADPDRLRPDIGISPLSLAALLGDLDLARALLAAGGSVDVRNRDGSTPLTSAAFVGQVEMLELLLEKGADPAATNAKGEPVIFATEIPWDITSFVAGLLKLQLDRQEVESGRKVCARLLRARLAEAGGQPDGSRAEKHP